MIYIYIYIFVQEIDASVLCGAGVVYPSHSNNKIQMKQMLPQPFVDADAAQAADEEVAVSALEAAALDAALDAEKRILRRREGRWLG